MSFSGFEKEILEEETEWKKSLCFRVRFCIIRYKGNLCEGLQPDFK